MQSISRRHALWNLTALTGSALLTGCAVNPVTGEREFMLMREKDEISLGTKAHGQILDEYGSYNDTSLQEWFAVRGNSMSKITHRPNLPWNFTVLDSPVVNAFAVPGGYVYVTRGILAFFNDEAQFAGVLGHELGHVNARHSAAKYSQTIALSVGIALGSMASEQFKKYSQFVSLGTALLFLKYSRENEREADRLGVEYSSQAGYDATHMSDFFHTLERLQPGGGSLPEWLSTHPDPGDRVKATRNMSLQFQQAHPDREYVTHRNDYLDRINGLVYGDDPRQGYTRDGYFNHPGMKLRFPVPDGWSVSNQQREVRMSNESALIIFAMTQGETPSGAAGSFSEENDITVTASGQTAVNGMEAFRSEGVMTSDDQQLGVLSYFIRMNDTIYAFHGVTEAASLAQQQATFEHAAKGFAPLTSAALLNVSPRQVEVRSTDSTMTFRKAMNRYGVSEDEVAQLAVLNAVMEDEQLAAGYRLKIVPN